MNFKLVSSHDAFGVRLNKFEEGLRREMCHFTAFYISEMKIGNQKITYALKCRTRTSLTHDECDVKRLKIIFFVSLEQISSFALKILPQRCETETSLPTHRNNNKRKKKT